MSQSRSILTGRATWGIVAVILVGALLLRTYHLSLRGLQAGDESRYYGGAAKVAAHIRWALGRIIAGRSGSAAESQQALMASVMEAGGTKQFIPSTKPIFGLLAAAFLILLGPSTYHFMLLNAILGTATVLIIFAMARRLQPDSFSYALAAALALGLSGFHLMWSRSGYAQATAVCLYALGLAFYARAAWGPGRSRRWFFIAGLALGASAAAHPVLWVYLPVCWVTEGYRTLRERAWRRGGLNLALLMAGVLLVAGCMELLTWRTGQWLPAAFPDLYRDGLARYSQGLDHSQDVMTGDKQGLQIDWRWRVSGYLLMPFLYGEGLVLSGLAVIGLWLLARRLPMDRSGRWFFIGAGLVVPIALLLAADTKPYDRNLAPLSVSVALLAALTLVAGWRRLPRFVSGWAVAAFVVLQFLHAAYLFDLRSGYALAAEWLSHHGGGTVLVPHHGKETPWFTNGVHELYYVRSITADGSFEAVDVPWERRRRSLPMGTRLYAGLVNEGKQMPSADAAWARLIDFDAPVGRFPNTAPETAKKLELLRTARVLARRMGWDGAVARMDRLIEKEERVIASGALSLYPLKQQGLAVTAQEQIDVAAN